MYKGRNPINAILNSAYRNRRPILRDPLAGKMYDPAHEHAPSNKPVELEYLDDQWKPKKKHPQFHFPTFSFYNLWTYDKALFQDRCPTNQFLNGRFCIYSPHIIT
ncbi:uncharacterized protein LOC125240846 [Leguminivora glycinivorella]|uniref:uncharacterized protein LOC125240846 n=1 Tax=Leguminivora glycinivorella TaxID=1035111 RepID=UPI0020109698|nr:uncharacterized protein LOC125240846 [Leguminivora glycinivorella]